MNNPVLNMRTVLQEISNERMRQIDVKGWDHAHDDKERTDGELAAAAGCYALHAGGGFTIHDYTLDRATNLDVPHEWPFDPEAWKPKDPRRDLIRAAALIVAEIERLDRAA